jgi:hypothetical protein
MTGANPVVIAAKDIAKIAAKPRAVIVPPVLALTTADAPLVDAPKTVTLAVIAAVIVRAKPSPSKRGV